jgi:hypothetical protein
MDVVQLVKDSKGKFEWTEVCSENARGDKLFISVMRDAMKFDDMPAMTWDYKPVYVVKDGVKVEDDRLFDGVRMPATAHELQQIADLVSGMLMTPLVIGLLWLQAGLKFDSVVNVKGKIVATSNIHDVHEAIEAAITKLGGDDGTKLVDCVGKFWCLINDLNYKGIVEGDECACNYGWFAKQASGPGLTPGTQCWQRPGFKHNKQHWDPSQTIRFMYQWGRLVRADGSEKYVLLTDIAQDPDLCSLLTHDGKPLTYLRQKGVDKLEPLVEPGVITLPMLTIEGRGPVA